MIFIKRNLLFRIISVGVLTLLCRIVTVDATLVCTYKRFNDDGSTFGTLTVTVESNGPQNINFSGGYFDGLTIAKVDPQNVADFRDPNDKRVAKCPKRACITSPDAATETFNVLFQYESCPGGETPALDIDSQSGDLTPPASNSEPQQTFHLGDDPKIRDICESSGFLTVLHMVLIIVNILKLAVPLVLIGMLTMDIYPLIGNPGEVSKVVKKSKNRLIAAVLIFFVPTIMQIILNALGDSTTVSTCYDHATDTGYIEDRKNAEKAYFSGNGSTSENSSQNGGSNNGNSGGGSTWRSDGDDGGFDGRSGKF